MKNSTSNRNAIEADDIESEELQAFCNTPFLFERFYDVPLLCLPNLATSNMTNDIRLSLKTTMEATENTQWCPIYIYAIYCAEIEVGEISLKPAYNPFTYYTGHVGFWIEEPHRLQGIATLACRTLIQLAKMHHMPFLHISHEEKNIASSGVCRKLKARFIRTTELPDTINWRGVDRRFETIYRLDL